MHQGGGPGGWERNWERGSPEDAVPADILGLGGGGLWQTRERALPESLERLKEAGSKRN